MSTANVDDLASTLLVYFQNYLKNNMVDANAKLDDLGFESIDYIDLATFIFETTGQWLDISKVGNSTRISDILSCLINPNLEKPKHKIRVKLDDWQRYVYIKELTDKNSSFVNCIIKYFCLKEHVDIPKLKRAIAETLNNHYILSSRLRLQVDDYYFERMPIPSDFTFKGSLLFSKRELDKLIIRIQSDRLVNIYIQKKNKQHYLIIALHHIAVDGWASLVIQEEIFRRYAQLHDAKEKVPAEDIRALTTIYPASLNEQSNTDELRSLLKNINPYEYNKLDHLFHGKLRYNYNYIVIKKKDIDQYALDNSINDFSYSVIFTFMIHQIISKLSGIDKLFIYMSLSNRYLPVQGIKELVTNLATGLPVFLNSANMNSRQVAANISKTLKVYFKHMSYGAITRVLLENDTLLNQFISPFTQPYSLGFTYINNPSKIIYGNDSITSNYLNWDKSGTYLGHNNDARSTVFFYVQNRGSEFHLTLHSRMKKGLHPTLVDELLKLIFQDVPSSACSNDNETIFTFMSSIGRSLKWW